MPRARLIPVFITLAASLAAAPLWSDEPSAATTPKATATPSGAKKPEGAKTAANAPRKERPDCLKSTGSRIPPRPGECLNEPGHSWTHEDFDSTGKTTAAGGLRALDPALH